MKTRTALVIALGFLVVGATGDDDFHPGVVTSRGSKKLPVVDTR